MHKNLILMGVSGCGKTLIGQKLSRKTGLPFYDGDDFHPPANVEKMRSGQPLNDRDRLPWLKSLAEQISKMDKEGGGVIACSALKHSYRDILGTVPEADVDYVYLKGDKQLIASRLADREGHYMPPELLNSQFQDLEEPENAVVINIDNTPERIVDEIVNKLE